MAVIFNETFESTGYDETWSLGEVISAGSAVDEDATTPAALFPLRARALKVTVNTAADDAYVGNVLSADEPIIYFRCFVKLDSHTLTIGEQLNFASLLDASSNLLWTLNFDQTGGPATRRVVLNAYHDATINQIAGPVDGGSIDTVAYRCEVQWDTTNDVWEFRVNGTSYGNGTLTAAGATREPRRIIAGSLGSQTSTTGVYNLDNVTLDDATWLGPHQPRAGESGLRLAAINNFVARMRAR